MRTYIHTYTYSHTYSPRSHVLQHGSSIHDLISATDTHSLPPRRQSRMVDTHTASTCVCMCMYVCVYVYVCMYICVCMYVYVCMRSYNVCVFECVCV